MPLERIDIEQYLLTGDMLSKHGYNHYEISNYALKNKECMKNTYESYPFWSFTAV